MLSSFWQSRSVCWTVKPRSRASCEKSVSTQICKVYKNFSREAERGGEKSKPDSHFASPDAQRVRHFKNSAKGEAFRLLTWRLYLLQFRPIEQSVPNHVTCHECTDSRFLISKKLCYLYRLLYLVFDAKRSLPNVSSRLAFVHKVILVGKKSPSTWAVCILYVKWISPPGLNPRAENTCWARRELLCRGTGGLTHSNFLALDQTSERDARIQQNNTLLCNRNSTQSEQKLTGTKCWCCFLSFFFFLQQKLETGTLKMLFQRNKGWNITVVQNE